MSAFRLQTFAPAARPGRQLTEAERRLNAAREEGFREGFAEGQGAATEAFLQDQSRLTAELVEAVNDAIMTNEAARRHVAASLAPVLRALAAAIAPALAEAGVADEIAAIVDRAVTSAPAARPRLRCAPELAARLRATCRERGIDAIVEEAPELLPREAQIFWEQGFDHIDLDACAAEVLACIETHLHPLADDTDEVRYG